MFKLIVFHYLPIEEIKNLFPISLSPLFLSLIFTALIWRVYWSHDFTTSPHIHDLMLTFIWPLLLFKSSRSESLNRTDCLHHQEPLSHYIIPEYMLYCEMRNKKLFIFLTLGRLTLWKRVIHYTGWIIESARYITMFNFRMYCFIYYFCKMMST